MKSWKTMSFLMLAIIVLFNVLLMREMPDSSAGSIHSVRRAASDGSRLSSVKKGEAISRRLGAAESRGSDEGSTPGLLKRWIQLGKSASEKRAPSSSLQSSSTTADMAVTKDQSGEQKYLSHPHFAGRSPVTSDTTQSRQNPSDGAAGDQQYANSDQSTLEGKGTAASGAGNASVLNAELTQALIERPARLESLSEAFAQRQEIIAAVAVTNGSEDAMVVSEALPLAVPISETLDITKESSPVEQQQQQQQQALLDVQERPRAPVDPGAECTIPKESLHGL